MKKSEWNETCSQAPCNHEKEQDTAQFKVLIEDTIKNLSDVIVAFSKNSVSMNRTFYTNTLSTNYTVDLNSLETAIRSLIEYRRRL